MTIYAGVVEGDLTLFKGDDASEVTRIEGNLDLNEGAICASPQLTNIGGFLDISDGAVCNFPRMSSIGGYPVPPLRLTLIALMMARRINDKPHASG